jgi:UDP-N-acetylmuramoyl-tripeptide--D-alanyl-D-alanine ligase
LNAAAAAAAGLAAGIPLDAAAKALAGAALSKWRMELQELPGGVTLLNDSYNANPDSARAALDSLAAIEGGRRIAVLGDMAELGDASAAEHFAIGEYAAARADIVIAVGETSRPIAEGTGERAIAMPDNESAIDWLRGRLAPGDIVLVKASREAKLDEIADAIAAPA